MDDSNPEEQFTNTDTPVALVPDQLGAPLDTQQITPTQENVQTGSPNYPIELALDTKCPLSETLRNLRQETLGYHSNIMYLNLTVKSLTFAFLDMADIQGLTVILSCSTFCCVMESICCCFRLLSQLNEKEREYQELLRSSVCKKQKRIDALRTAAAAPEGKTFAKCLNFIYLYIFCGERASNEGSTFTCVLYQHVKVRSIRTATHSRKKKH